MGLILAFMMGMLTMAMIVGVFFRMLLFFLLWLMD